MPTLETSSEPSLRRPPDVERRGLCVDVVRLVGCPAWACALAGTPDSNEAAANPNPETKILRRLGRAKPSSPFRSFRVLLMKSGSFIAFLACCFFNLSSMGAPECLV